MTKLKKILHLNKELESPLGIYILADLVTDGQTSAFVRHILKPYFDAIQKEMMEKKENADSTDETVS